jgi:hypothetical protein
MMYRMLCCDRQWITYVFLDDKFPINGNDISSPRLFGFSDLLAGLDRGNYYSEDVCIATSASRCSNISTWFPAELST